jgi:hypothetical protein
MFTEADMEKAEVLFDRIKIASVPEIHIAEALAQAREDGIKEGIRLAQENDKRGMLFRAAIEGAREEGRIEGMKDVEAKWRDRFRSKTDYEIGVEEGRRDMKEKAVAIAEDWFSIAPKYRTKQSLAQAISKL